MEYKLTHRQFYEALKEERLLGLKCNTCGAYTAPPKMTCDACGSLDLEVSELQGTGEIKTFTVIWVAPEGFTAPYVVAIAQMQEGPWLMGQVEGVDPQTMPLELIGKKVLVSHKVVPAGNYTAGEGVTVAFQLQE